MTAWTDDAATVREAIGVDEDATGDTQRFCDEARAALGRLTALLETQEQERAKLADQGRIAGKRYSEEIVRRMGLERDLAALRSAHDTETTRLREGLEKMIESPLVRPVVRQHIRGLLAGEPQTEKQT